jgi:SAM-dependent methyltransferase
VVHAHQVLQHVADPVQALREMAAVCRPGGLVAVRESDYRAFAWFPESAGLTRWMELYQAAATANGGRAAGRPATAVLGARGGVHRRASRVQHLVLRDGRGPSVVGRHVG